MNGKTPIPLDINRTQPAVDALFNATHASTRARKPDDGIVAKRRTGGDFRPNPVGDQVRSIPVSVEQFEKRQREHAAAQRAGLQRLDDERRTYGMFVLPPAH